MPILWAAIHAILFTDRTVLLEVFKPGYISTTRGFCSSTFLNWQEWLLCFTIDAIQMFNFYLEFYHSGDALFM